MNRCVCCGAVIPEGTMVCHNCIDKSLKSDTKSLLMFPGRCNGKTATMTKYIRLDIDDIRNEAVDEFVQALKDRIRTKVMPRFEAKIREYTVNDDYMYGLGAKMCHMDIDIEIAKLLREFKEREKPNEETHSN